jgi:choline-glycine betaine transporter
MSCPFAQYSDVFGQPKTGFHALRVFDIAVNDLFGTVFISGIISYVFNYRFTAVLFILLVLGIILHRLFCVNTTINKWIFGEVK